MDPKSQQLTDREAWTVIGVVVAIAAVLVIGFQVLFGGGSAVKKEQSVNTTPTTGTGSGSHDSKTSLESNSITPNGEADIYVRDVHTIRLAVLANTIKPDSAHFCPRFEVLVNKRGNRVYVGWYTSEDLLGVRGKDNVLAELDSSGTLLKLSIGEI